MTTHLPAAPAATFRTALDDHLDAIRARDLDRLAATVTSGELVLVTGDGELLSGRDTFLSMHRDWFASDSWTIDARLERVIEGSDLAVAWLALDYRDVDEHGRRHAQHSVLSLVFRLEDGRWLMAGDQNTPTLGVE